MSPILVRPVREQLEHDRVIRLLQAKYKKKFEAVINPGHEQNASVMVGTSPWFPDVALFTADKARKLAGTVEVETAESVNNLEAMSQWKTFALQKAPFHLYVPASSIDTARRMAADLEISVAEIWAYSTLGDQMRFTMVQRSAAAEAILTTDSRVKTVVVRGEGFVVGGMAKGSGMLRPDMATMLCVLTTDAAVDSPTLGRALAGAVPVTFNSLNVDGCESTNDSVVLLASGKGAPAAADEFGRAVEAACRQLAYEMAADAEGASRVVKLRIRGAGDDESARNYGRAVADSALVRSSFYGGDPNWGRILAALGTCQIQPFDVSIAYEGVRVASQGCAYPFDDQKLAKLLTGDFVVDVAVGGGEGAAEIVTTDLTPDYVRFNGERS